MPPAAYRFRNTNLFPVHTSPFAPQVKMMKFKEDLQTELGSEYQSHSSPSCFTCELLRPSEHGMWAWWAWWNVRTPACRVTRRSVVNTDYHYVLQCKSIIYRGHDWAGPGSGLWRVELGQDRATGPGKVIATRQDGRVGASRRIRRCVPFAVT